jgi:hypothetical protein
VWCSFTHEIGEDDESELLSRCRLRGRVDTHGSNVEKFALEFGLDGCHCHSHCLGRGDMIFRLRQRLGIGGAGSAEGTARVLHTTGASCWVELLAGVTTAMATGGWPEATWRHLIPHVLAERAACPEALRPRVVQVLELALKTAKDPFVAAHIRQLLDALRR